VIRVLQTDTDSSRPIQHGGDINAVRKRYGLGNRPLIDFSVSINAMGMSPKGWEAARESLNKIERYPVTGCPKMTEFLAEYHDVPKECVIVGAGTTELISLLCESLREPLNRRARELGDPDMALAHLTEPAYAEYRRASSLNQLRPQAYPVHNLRWSQDFFPHNGEGIYWTGHPNNPTGHVWNTDELLGLIDENPDLLTVVDEAYLPFLPDEADRTLVPDVVDRDNLVVMRSMTKFYAMPGLRVGYMIADPEIISRVRHFQEPWTVAAPAEDAAMAVLEDEDYRQKAVDSIVRESKRVLDALWEIPGVRPVWPGAERPGDCAGLPNFLLISVTDPRWTSARAHEALARSGVIVRECTNYKGLEIGSVLTGADGQAVPTQGHLRFAIRSRAENDTLLDTIRSVISQGPPIRKD
jgi:threonine-phosphate decarboxylase